LRVLAVAHHRQHLGADRVAVEIERFAAAAFEEQVTA